MSLENLNIYEAQGDSRDIVLAWQAERDGANAKRDAFAKTFAEDAKAFGTPWKFYGISTKAKLNPDEWRPSKEDVRGASGPCWEPNRKTKVGKGLAKTMESKPFMVPDERALSAKFEGFDPFTACVDRGLALFYMHAQVIGDKAILFVPDPKKLGVPHKAFVPEGRPMKLSEYHALIESIQEAEATAKA